MQSDSYPFRVFLDGGGISDQEGISCLWSLVYSPKDKSRLLPQIRVSVMVANSDLHETCSRELPFIPLVFLLLFTFLGLAYLLKLDLLGLSLESSSPPPPLPIMAILGIIEDFSLH